MSLIKGGVLPKGSQHLTNLVSSLKGEQRRERFQKGETAIKGDKGTSEVRVKKENKGSEGGPKGDQR